ncbi:hypothetical protein PpBr36_07613, partial [Pyricularia pennisetigena]|uniref:hypothetical protein n=1 Tax=Pyricularia pennisetigena TaxID=1578925 RepID=UPI0011527F86
AAVAMQQQQSLRLPPLQLLQINTTKAARTFPSTEYGDSKSNHPTTPTSDRSHRKPTTPSPLLTATAASDDIYNNPTACDPSSLHTSRPHIITNSRPHKGQLLSTATIGQIPVYTEPPSLTSTTTSDEPHTTTSFLRIPHDTKSAPDIVRPSTQPEGSQAWPAITMAGPRVEAAKGAPRNSSIDSAISAISTSSHSHKNLKSSVDSPAGPLDIGNLIKAAGSAEAVIQYLLKEKTSQAQQNSQLWRLVDKQRAMILGLNKDLERALKDKEKYRKKLKEVLVTPEVPPLPTTASLERSMTDPTSSGRPPPQLQKLNVPLSPVLDSDSQKHSPIEVALAPYPITPPADQPNGPPTAVGEMLDPSHTMPKAHEHALDQYDHEAEEREAEDARKVVEELEVPIHLAMPPTRSPPSEPPQMPPPKPPVPSMNSSDGLSQFPLPPAPPPRKPPPAPIHIQANTQTSTDDGEADTGSTDSDLDGLIGVAKGAEVERRGRRRTREEDEHDREIIALKEAERRSLSKKSNKSTASSKGTPREELPVPSLPASPPAIPRGSQAENPSMLTLLKADERDTALPLPPPLKSPGLPSSPRPFAVGAANSSFSSPPLSPRQLGAFASAPLSPRPPRQPIPLPLNTPQQTPPSEELKSPKPLNIVKKAMDALTATSPTKHTSLREGPVGEGQVYTGFVTEEYPDLLLPPNALLSIEVKVASSRMKPSRASLLSLTQLEEDPVFTLAVLLRGQGTELWRVEKDSVSLAKLDQRLKQCPAFTAKTPDRSLFSGHAPAKLDARRMALDLYLDELLNTPLDTETAIELCKYLSTNTLPANADETGIAIPRPDSQPQKAGPGGRPFRTGYLTKRGKNFGGWKARFFVLEGPQLRYYETPGGAHLGTIKLQKAQIGKQSAPQTNDTSSPSSAAGGSEEMDNQYRHAFLILEPKKKDPTSMTKHVLCAESDTERDQWVDALLRWIDYREPEEEEAKKKEVLKKEPKQGQSGDGRIGRSNSKQKKSGRPQKPQDAESLIAVNYEATQQGEMPHSAPNRKGNSGPNYDQPCPTPMGMSSQQSFAISGPQNPQPISDSASWGSRTGGSGLVPPDEKKIRKRSFFGFATKQPRGSSDGTDSLFGGESSSGPSAASGGHPTGPFRQAFGAPLSDAVKYNAPFDVKVPLPAVVYRCIQYLEANNALNEEGIFRLSGSNVVIKQLRERFNAESDVNLVADEAYHDIHAVASLLKLYLRELPTTILTRDLHMHFVSVTEMPNSAAKVAALNELVGRLPTANATLLKYLIAFLIRIINKSNINKMTVRNVGIVFSPTLNIPAPVFAMFLQNYEGIFGIDAEQYELPSQRDWHGEQSRYHDEDVRSVDMNAMPMQRPSAPRRPSMASIEQVRPMTSGQGGSPHRQRLAEQERQRSSPEPRIGLGQLTNSQMRPTPAPQQQQQPPQPAYDPQYLSQQGYQGIPTAMSNRPAYEGGFAMPQSFDMSQLHTPMGPRMVNPGYDRPLYEGGSAASNSGYDAYNPGSSRSNRRESVLMGGAMMGGLNNQGSRSRLNQETHY